MIRITYLLSDGSSKTIEANTGDSIMQIAKRHDIAGILGRCGGFCRCGTCHVFVGEQWLNLLPAPTPDEDDLLSETATGRRPASRLGCQIKLTDELVGLVVTVPERQEF